MTDLTGRVPTGSQASSHAPDVSTVPDATSGLTRQEKIERAAEQMDERYLDTVAGRMPSPCWCGEGAAPRDEHEQSCPVFVTEPGRSATAVNDKACGRTSAHEPHDWRWHGRFVVAECRCPGKSAPARTTS